MTPPPTALLVADAAHRDVRTPFAYSVDEALAAADELGSAEIQRFLNRASDAVYAMARYADDPEPALFEGRE